MKTFKDLTFEPYPYFNGEHAFLEFDNGRAVSVITGEFPKQLWKHGVHTSDDKPYEVALIKKDGKLGCVYLDRDSVSVALAEDAPHNDVAAYCTEDEVTLIMKAIQIL